MKQLSIMIKPASAACNLRCKYCFYTDVADRRDTRYYGVMPLEQMRRMLQNLQPQFATGDRVNFAFQGGEPTLAGLQWFRSFTDITEQWDAGIEVTYALQTNATTLDEDWCRYLAEKKYLVGVSLDLLPQCHDDARVDASGNGTFQRCLHAVELLNAFHVEYNILCTLTRQIAKHPRQVWQALKQYDIRYVQFTPCLDTLEHPGGNPYALTPRRFSQFYNQLFPLWLSDYQKGNYRSVKLFDDVINLMAYGIPTACGIHGRCQPQLVVEADGNVYPCDFYCLDEYRVGNILDNSLEEILSAGRLSPVQKREPLPKLCGSCPYLAFCGGGCKRMQREIACTDRDSVCGYREFLNAAGADMQQIAAQLRHRGYAGA